MAEKMYTGTLWQHDKIRTDKAIEAKQRSLPAYILIEGKLPNQFKEMKSLRGKKVSFSLSQKGYAKGSSIKIQ
ncbi:hypothetical protein HYU19_02210 [Candidatus Woesearchaeota archaeon]|nr:hypothetical protein [Candidatus Woesearchaeota archaeon]